MASKSKMAAMAVMGTTAAERGMIQSNHLNTPRLQKGGRPSRSGGIFGAERQVHSNHINAPHNAKEWPSSGVIRNSNRGRIGVKGGLVAQSNGTPANHYSGGPINRNG
jgi:hypothetical protein